MMDAGATWTDERVELLKKLWGDGLSASQIAAELGGGMTRNAVLGKSHRLGLVRNGAAGVSTPRPRTVSRPLGSPLTAEPAMRPGPTPAINTTSQQPSKGTRAASLPVEEASLPTQRLTIMELREGMCRWPLGDPTKPEFRFCGSQGVVGLPYCTHHAQIAYQPTSDRKRLRA